MGVSSRFSIQAPKDFSIGAEGRMQQAKDGSLLFVGWHENLIDIPVFN
jgi:hypothetical protein